MRKVYILFIVLFISAFTAFGQEAYYVSSPGGLNLRKGPGTGYETLQSLPHRSKLVVIEQESEEWWKVKYQDQEGYVSAKYLSEEKPSGRNNNRKKEKKQASSRQNKGARSGNPASQAYKYGIGLRAGDPAGLNLIKYLPAGKGLELNIGRTALYGYDFKKHFEQLKDFNDYNYLDARFKSAVGIQLHYLSFRDLKLNGLEGLQWYYGLGAQARIFTTDYFYEYKAYHGPNGGDFRWERRWEVLREVDLGIDGTIGLNYNFANAPISLFADLTLFGEIYNNPFLLWFQGGFGARYNF